MSTQPAAAMGRPRYQRLWRLPTPRAVSVAFGVTVAAAGVAAAVGPAWAAFGAVALGGLATAAYLFRHRHRFAVERHLIRALVRSAAGNADRGADVRVPGLSTEIVAETTPAGVTRLQAGSWPDAVRAAGFVMTRDRGFQMDILRRMASGRLAEVLGKAALPSDEHYRAAGLAAAAAAATAQLEPPERDLLAAFTAGANAAFAQLGPPFECRFLSYEPQPWTIGDSVLLALFMFHTLSFDVRQKRADAVIRHVFPEPVARFFLTADGDTTDGDTTDGDGEPPKLPPDLVRFYTEGEVAGDVIGVDHPVAGSNCWVAAAGDGPLLACDLHLPLTLPNALYEVDLRWPGGSLRGLALVGLPIVLTGTNGDIVWGVTDLSADVVDLVPVDDRTVREHTERIRVRGGAERHLTVVREGALPVAPQPLLGRRVAIRWTGYDPRGCDLKFQRLAHAASVDEGVRVLDGAHGAALNVLLADAAGHQAHLVTGLIPRRPAGAAAADGYLTGAERPRVVDPPSRILVSANDAALPAGDYRVGYDVDPGHRARRIREVLSRLVVDGRTSATAMLALQHDIAARAYEPYRDLAVAAVAARRGPADRAIETLLSRWDGTADTGALAFGVLVRLRAIVAQRVLAPLLTVCREHEPGFVYAPSAIDQPLLAIVGSGDPNLLPPGDRDRGWPEFVAGCVDEAVEQVRRSNRRRRIPRWGDLNTVGLSHPLTLLARWAGPLLDIAPRPQPGALHCVRVCVPGFGAAGRVVLSPGRPGVAHVDVPAGQSGHPLSRHFQDRHPRWASARRIPTIRDTDHHQDER